MCGRFGLIDPDRIFQRYPQFHTVVKLQPRYNIAPTQQVPVVRNTGKGEVELLRWGLVPPWASNPVIGSSMINARIETVAQKSAYREPFRHRRALILASGFYEWALTPHGKQPMWFSLKSGDPMAFAALWERCTNISDEPLETCTIITGPPNTLLANVHDRMPVILREDAFQAWLDPDARSPDELLNLLKPYPAEEMESAVVSHNVNSAYYDRADIFEPDLTLFPLQ